MRSHVVLHEWLAFHSAFLNIHRSGVLTALAWLVSHETAAVSMQVLCTPYNRAPCHIMQSQIRKVYVCLAVTCHLHLWQNDWDLLCATVVTWGWNRYWNRVSTESQTWRINIMINVWPSSWPFWHLFGVAKPLILLFSWILYLML